MSAAIFVYLYILYATGIVRVKRLVGRAILESDRLCCECGYTVALDASACPECGAGFDPVRAREQWTRAADWLGLADQSDERPTPPAP